MTSLAIRRNPCVIHQVAEKQLALVQRRFKATAAAVKPERAENESASSNEQTEWENAKSYEEIPGRRSVPILGTTWGFMPVVGKKAAAHSMFL